MRSGDGLLDLHPGQRYDVFTGELKAQRQKIVPPPQAYEATLNYSKLRYFVPPSMATEFAKTTTSQANLQERQVKHVRNKKEVEERFNRPVTESQMQTWGRDERYAAMPPRFGRIACAETKISEAQILGARHV